jgi:hypothetical protein
MATHVDESADERDELKELLEELRVILPGAQVLFAFLLTAPLMSRFNDLSATLRRVYFSAFLASALAVVLLIAPSMLNRLRRSGQQIPRLLKLSTTLSTAGAASLALAICAVVYLNTSLLYGAPLAGAASAAIAGSTVWFWFGLPLRRRATGR